MAVGTGSMPQVIASGGQSFLVDTDTEYFQTSVISIPILSTLNSTCS